MPARRPKRGREVAPVRDVHTSNDDENTYGDQRESNEEGMSPLHNFGTQKNDLASMTFCPRTFVTPLRAAAETGDVELFENVVYWLCEHPEDSSIHPFEVNKSEEFEANPSILNRFGTNSRAPYRLSKTCETDRKGNACPLSFAARRCELEMFKVTANLQGEEISTALDGSAVLAPTGAPGIQHAQERGTALMEFVNSLASGTSLAQLKQSAAVGLAEDLYCTLPERVQILLDCGASISFVEKRKGVNVLMLLLSTFRMFDIVETDEEREVTTAMLKSVIQRLLDAGVDLPWDCVVGDSREYTSFTLLLDEWRFMPQIFSLLRAEYADDDEVYSVDDDDSYVGEGHVESFSDDFDCDEIDDYEDEEKLENVDEGEETESEGTSTSTDDVSSDYSGE